ncbi:unnamed protein product [Paramecium primaurelia]|uniref:Uncharacterized protein n=1 Tax=Paramecium primaurelia TaxID=5886 RepID=A0A8S1QMG7_PARPR|nr:unnamed protein product [Paramecium primaurelia]
MAKKMKTVYLALNPLREFIGEFKIKIIFVKFIQIQIYTFSNQICTLLNANKVILKQRKNVIIPLIVNKNMIIFFECYSNQLNWQFDLTCQKYLFLSDLGSEERYYFDGTIDYISYSRQCKKCIIDNFIYCLKYLCYNQNFCSLLPSYPILENKSQNQNKLCTLQRQLKF